MQREKDDYHQLQLVVRQLVEWGSIGPLNIEAA